jgi:hypothetical protein
LKQKRVTPKLIFRTIKDGEKTYCGVRDDGRHLSHRFIDERNGHGHDPGYVYLVYLPTGPYRGCYHIGKVEYTKIGTDDFDLDKIHVELLRELQRRLNGYHPAKTKDDQKYNGAQFVHGIRVACGEGAEKQPHHLFRLKKLSGGEIFDLKEEDIEILKKAEGSILGRDIKHLSAEVFAGYLANQGLPDETIREWVVLPENKKITVDRLKQYLVTKNSKSSLSFKDVENIARNLAKPLMKTRPASTHVTLKGGWYVVDGLQGVEIPTFFKRCIESLRKHGAVHVVLRKNIDAEDKIFRFKNHWRYQDYTRQYQITHEEWQTIFETVRSAKTF